jgi:hypothetical protein
MDDIGKWGIGGWGEPRASPLTAYVPDDTPSHAQFHRGNVGRCLERELREFSVFPLLIAAVALFAVSLLFEFMLSGIAGRVVVYVTTAVMLAAYVLSAASTGQRISFRHGGTQPLALIILGTVGIAWSGASPGVALGLAGWCPRTIRSTVVDEIVNPGRAPNGYQAVRHPGVHSSKAVRPHQHEPVNAKLRIVTSRQLEL